MKKWQKAYEFYIRNAKLIGAFYLIIPVVIWFLVMILTVPFREVYILRVIISLVVGIPIASFLNQYGLNLWLTKYNSKGGANELDGFLIGSSLGIGIALFPSLTSLIATNHPNQAKNFIIISYLSAALIGGIIGSLLAKIRKSIVT